MALTDNAPTREIGHAGPFVAEWMAWVDPLEDLAIWQWPNYLRLVTKMRTDSQVDALSKAVVLPLLRRRWCIDPAGAKAKVVDQVASDMNLPIRGQPPEDAPRRARRRFNHTDHLRHALLALWYGHMYFEQYGDVVNDPDDPDEDLRWKLRRLGVRLPSSIAKIEVARDGGLVSITQHQSKFNPDPIPVSQLLAYVWDREGANWLGRSMYRPLYRHWLVKDRLVRIDAMKNERYGVGIPTGKAAPGANDRQLAVYGDLVRSVRAGEDTGVAIPHGADIGIEGIRGALPDTIGSIRLHDEAMARNFLAMFAQLGQTETGSRALGDAFIAFFDMSLDAVATWYATTTTEHQIEDMVDWNWGPEERAPRLTWETEGDDDQLGVDELARLIESEALKVDGEVEDWVRDRFGLPARPEDAEGMADEEPVPPVLPFPVPDEATTDGSAVAAASGAGTTRPRIRAAAQTLDKPPTGHRERNDHEVAAAFDPVGLQESWQSAVEDVVDAWRTQVQPVQIDALVDAVEAAVAAGSADGLASLSAPVLGTQLLADIMLAAAEDAVSGARAEAAAQGVVIELIDTAELESPILRRANAVSVLMARALSESAARQALLRYGADSVLTPGEVAAGVRGHLESLSDAYLNDQLGGAMTQAQNTGRRAVFARRPCTVYASELLDTNTCKPCFSVDGHQYANLAAAEADYPTGGHKHCQGGPRCRGTLVAVYDEAAPSVT